MIDQIRNSDSGSNQNPKSNLKTMETDKLSLTLGLPQGS